MSSKCLLLLVLFVATCKGTLLSVCRPLGFPSVVNNFTKVLLGKSFNRMNFLELNNFWEETKKTRGMLVFFYKPNSKAPVIFSMLAHSQKVFMPTLSLKTLHICGVCTYIGTLREELVKISLSNFFHKANKLFF